MSFEASTPDSGEVLCPKSTCFPLLLNRTREARALCGFQHHNGEKLSRALCGFQHHNGEKLFGFLFSEPMMLEHHKGETLLCFLFCGHIIVGTPKRGKPPFSVFRIYYWDKNYLNVSRGFSVDELYYSCFCFLYTNSIPHFHSSFYWYIAQHGPHGRLLARTPCSWNVLPLSLIHI